MKIRGFAWLLLLPIVIAALVELGVVLKLNAVNLELDNITTQRRNMRKLVEEMRMSSEFLTRFSRRYALFKEDTMLEWYNQILDIRDGKLARPQAYDTLYWDLVAVGLAPPPDSKRDGGTPITVRFSQISPFDIATQKFIEAKAKSDALSRIELIAIHAAKGEFDDGTGKFRLAGKPDQKFATHVLYDEAYRQAKAEVMQPLAEVMSIVDGQTKNRIDDLEHASTVLTHMQVLLSAGMLFWASIGGAYLYLRVVKRLAKLDETVSLIDRGNMFVQFDVGGRDEIGKIGETLAKMASKISSSFDELEKKSSALEIVSKDLVAERNQTERLLNNIFPAVIAAKFRNGEETIAETFSDVTVFFADIVDFTGLSSSLGPRQTVDMLSDMFGRLDALADKFNIERIKTVSDCYLAVSGLPSRDAFHCQHVAQFALSAQKVALECSERFGCPIEIRIGIHTGTVAAGVVGKEKFSFELWGDVVDLARLFEANAEPNRIRVSDVVKVRLSDDFLFEDAPEVKAKGKRPVVSYYLKGEKDNYRDILGGQSRGL